ncbi:proton-conducting transporter membrane subunit [Phenylobacterium sp.]|uniref:proton-conducting transporter transmembrane domain-containing protein n=1 Tax=Phenylobacterium sp. TaxID=1871053 RepID=UPI002731DFE4|nr:proton-conducting transporter membrane subunit [Phenylobacterium sp.]MDP2212869.1 proton-conducting transporter membrane subunit [Phenylobacterium sp.]
MSLDTILLFAAPGTPILLSLLALVPATRPTLFRLLPFAALPALAAALWLPTGLSSPLPLTLLGAGLTLTETGQVFLAVAALLWTLAGIFVQRSVNAHRERFAGFWLATLSGNMLLFLAADVASFYLAFALLSLSAFGLVAHYGSPEARRAARVYLALAILGETLLLMGLLIGVQAAGTTLIPDVRTALAAAQHRDLAIGLLLAGFGIKAGLMPLHVWLPLAHPAAPAPASAVLSGAIVKAGVFGLMSFLPLQADAPGWSATMVIIGLVTAYLGVAFGVVQQRAKTVLAYSTLSQMGLLVVVIGSGFGSPALGLILAAVTLYSAHHSLAKGALFLSVGLMEKCDAGRRRIVLAAAAVAALAIAGLPLTGGALAKLAIKGPISESLAAPLVTLSAVGTTLLMLRFLQLLRRTAPSDHRPAAALWIPFVAAVAAALALPWALFPNLSELTPAYVMRPINLWAALWPLLVGAGVMIGALKLPRPINVSVPEGDIVVLLERGAEAARRLVRRLRGIRPPQISAPAMPDLAMVERALARWPLAGAALLGMAGVIAASLILA